MMVICFIFVSPIPLICNDEPSPIITSFVPLIIASKISNYIYLTCHMIGCTVFDVHSILATMLSNVRAASA
jgi:hypothetical protein